MSELSSTGVDIHVTAALAGDRVALAALANDLLPTIRRAVLATLYRRARPQRRDPRQEAEDFVQEVWLALFAEGGRMLRCWDPRRGHSLTSFVRLVARQRVAQILRGRRGNPWGDEATEHATIERLLPLEIGAERHIESRASLRALLEHLRGRLSERGLALFERLHVEQRDIAEVASELGMSRAAVDAWNSRMRATVRDFSGERSAERLAAPRRSPHFAAGSSRRPTPVFAQDPGSPR